MDNGAGWGDDDPRRHDARQHVHQQSPTAGSIPSARDVPPGWHTLNDGTTLPPIGFGTWPLRGVEARDVVAAAIGHGYRLIDSAERYENEGGVGAGLRTSGVPREGLRFTTKIRGDHQEAGATRQTVEESLFRTGLDYLDLVLIHWPLPRLDKYSEVFGALLQAKADGLVRSVGVSNFLPEHLDRLVADHGVAPSVNQIELHPYLPQVDQLAADGERGVRTEAWSPLGRAGDLLEDPVICAIARAHDVGPGTVVLDWEIARGVVPLPKASSAERRLANLAALDLAPLLSADDLAAITALGRGQRVNPDQDPATWEEF
ncbi:aldo/keto reductase [Miniimonas arenae]|uniref:aldo/keto reductase n=1 Tax=Miniimonas arenae TaxID=676201 RepID=UPI001FEB3A85|nr:aldo/keto reductase [Miniimonas arenae]